MSNFFVVFLSGCLLSVQGNMFGGIHKYVVYRYRALFLLWTKVKVQLSQGDWAYLREWSKARPESSDNVWHQTGLAKLEVLSKLNFTFPSLSLFCVLWWVKHLTASGFMYHHADCSLPFSSQATQGFLLLEACFFLSWMLQTLVVGIYPCRDCSKHSIFYIYNKARLWKTKRSLYIAVDLPCSALLLNTVPF